MAAGVKAYQQGNYPEAEKQWVAALKEAEGFGPQDPRLATSLNDLGEVYRLQGKYAEAEPLYKRSLAIKEKALGPDHPRVATSLNNLGLVYHARGRYAEAEPLHKRALAIREKALGPEHPSVATSLNNLAGLYETQGKHTEAEPLYKRSLAIGEKALGPEHPNVATSLENHAILLRKIGRGAEAAKMEARAKAIRAKHAHEKPTRPPSANRPIQAGALTNYGVYFSSYENLDSAQQGWAEIWRKHWQMLTGIQPYIDYGSVRGGLPQYRLYGKGLSKAQAEGLCRNLQQRNQHCAVVNF